LTATRAVKITSFSVTTLSPFCSEPQVKTKEMATSQNLGQGDRLHGPQGCWVPSQAQLTEAGTCAALPSPMAEIEADNFHLGSSGLFSGNRKEFGDQYFSN
jgi:hypothetical protein